MVRLNDLRGLFQLMILFYSILFYSILFYSILFYSILFYSTLLLKTSIPFHVCCTYDKIRGGTASHFSSSHTKKLYSIRLQRKEE